MSFNSNTALKGCFERAIERADKVIPFDPNWRNDTGYYNGAVKVDVPPGEIWTSKDVEPNNRRLLFLGTLMGTFVIFERYSPQIETSNFVLVSNVPRRGSHILRSGSIGYNDFNYYMQLDSVIRHVYEGVQEKELERLGK